MLSQVAGIPLAPHRGPFFPGTKGETQERDFLGSTAEN